jgi:hypothetical protein
VDEDPAPDLVVRVRGAGGVDMRAQVVGETTDINPFSEFVLRQIIAATDTSLSDLSADDVAALIDLAKQFDLPAGADLAATVQQLERLAGDTIAQALAAAKAESGDAPDIAGAWHMLKFVVALLSEFDGDNVSGAFGIFMEQDTEPAGGGGSLTFADAGGGKFDVTGQVLRSEAVLSADVVAGVIQKYDLSTEITDPDAPAAVNKTVTAGGLSNGRLALSVPREEKLDPAAGVGRRTVTAPEILFPGSADVFIGLDTESKTSYSLNDAGDAIDPTDIVGRGTGFSVDIFAKVDPDLTLQDLNGQFGVVQSGVTLVPNSEIDVVISLLILDFLDGFITGEELALFLDWLDPDEVFGDLILDIIFGEYTMDSPLTLTIGVPPFASLFTGFAGPNGDLIVLSRAVDNPGVPGVPGVIPPIPPSATRSFMVGVRLGAANPDLAGRKYNILWIDLGFQATGTELVTQQGIAEFINNNDFTRSANERTIARDNYAEEFASKSDAAQENGTYAFNGPVLTINLMEGGAEV